MAGIPAIGEACEALKKAGWRASIAGNRITVDDDLFAQFIGATAGARGGVEDQVGDLQDRRHASGLDCWSGAIAAHAGNRNRDLAGTKPNSWSRRTVARSITASVARAYAQGQRSR